MCTALQKTEVLKSLPNSGEQCWGAHHCSRYSAAKAALRITFQRQEPWPRSGLRTVYMNKSATGTASLMLRATFIGHVSFVQRPSEACTYPQLQRNWGPSRQSDLSKSAQHQDQSLNLNPCSFLHNLLFFSLKKVASLSFQENPNKGTSTKGQRKMWLDLKHLNANFICQEMVSGRFRFSPFFPLWCSESQLYISKEKIHASQTVNLSKRIK